MCALKWIERLVYFNKKILQFIISILQYIPQSKESDFWDTKKFPLYKLHFFVLHGMNVRGFFYIDADLHVTEIQFEIKTILFDEVFGTFLCCSTLSYFFKS